MDPDDESLVRSVRTPEAFEPLVGRHSAALHAYLARRAPTASDDLLAEVWLQAFASRRSFRPGRGTARTWLFGIARHVLSAHWRASVPPPGHGEGDAADPWQAVDQRLDAASVAPALRRCLAALPAVERELLLLVCWEQLSPTEAAAVLGIPAGTARSRMHRARNRMRELLSDIVTSSQEDSHEHATVA